jgi:hypothetical protein
VVSGPAKSEGEWQELVREWFPELSGTRLRRVTWPTIGEHHDYIVEQFRRSVTIGQTHRGRHHCARPAPSRSPWE